MYIKRIIFIVLAIVVLFLSGIGYYSFYVLKSSNTFSITDTYIKDKIKNKLEENTIVLDRNNQKIGEFFKNYSIQLKYKDIPPSMIKAILAIEDRNFFNHSGIDFIALIRAIKKSITSLKLQQGASTITQQIVKNFLLSNEKTINRKIIEAYLSFKIEKIFSKHELLELYVNNMFLGNGSYGIEAAAKRYFNKTVKELKLEEVALIAGLFQSPSKYNPFLHPKLAKKRQSQVLENMYKASFISKSVYQKTKSKKLVYTKYTPLNNKLSPYFLDYIKEESEKILSQKIEGEGYKIYTTLDSDLQIQSINAINSLKQKLINIFKDEHYVDKILEKLEAATVSIDPHTGEILSMIGGKNYLQSQFNIATSSLRSSGSLFKTIVYTLALIKGYKWSDILFVSPISINGYKPKNVSSSFLNEVTLLKAFYNSLNTPTVDLGSKLGLEEIISMAANLGIKTPLRYEYGTILGSSEISFFDILRVYSVFANNGYLNEIHGIRKIVSSSGKVLYDSSYDIDNNNNNNSSSNSNTDNLYAKHPLTRNKKVLDDDIVFLMNEALKDVISFGTARRISDLSGYVAGKTGTTNDSKDNWFCGYSSNLLSLVWIGSSEHLPYKISGSSLAIPIWEDIVRNNIESPLDTIIPENIVSYKINPKYGTISTNGIDMFFIKGNEPDKYQSSYEIIDNYSGKYRNMFDNF